MERKDKVEHIHLAIQALIDEKKKREVPLGESFVADNEDQLVLSRLISQLESLKGDGTPKQTEPSAESSSPTVNKAEEKHDKSNEADRGSNIVGTEEIVKELKKVKRQNFITHTLLSIMILLTVGWQLSEVSLIMKVKEGVNHPFRSIGSMVTGMLKGSGMNGQDAEKLTSAAKKELTESHPLPLKLPELPHTDFPLMGLDVEQD